MCSRLIPSRPACAAASMLVSSSSLACSGNQWGNRAGCLCFVSYPSFTRRVAQCLKVMGLYLPLTSIQLISSLRTQVIHTPGTQPTHTYTNVRHTSNKHTQAHLHTLQCCSISLSSCLLTCCRQLCLLGFQSGSQLPYVLLLHSAFAGNE